MAHANQNAQLHDLSPIERMNARMEAAAKDILENVLRRRRWSVNDRDAIAALIGRVVQREINAARTTKKDQEAP